MKAALREQGDALDKRFGCVCLCGGSFVEGEREAPARCGYLDLREIEFHLFLKNQTQVTY